MNKEDLIIYFTDHDTRKCGSYRRDTNNEQ
jgi:hypothetical protein